MIATVF